ncbi:MAG: nucleotidyltransferase domain-containing protein [Bacillota bacterium]|jgi:predicted nucleotidyltransferase|nr:nucleotidyltransferase domain-containing protein [Candidatus Fermentithermobacillaceae bacterium]HAF66468.1 DNA polymerase III subunit beta [Clostridiales bacterium UBA9857]HPZ86019.1 nucleotidyltransferase domain-containing protein [Bacillota bacterium]
MQVQWEAVETILQAVKQCPEIKAAFLKGSLAKGIADEYSDVDFYCLVDTARLEQFLKKRLEILESYRPVIYHSESDFVGPQLVAVFDNGLHFDLYTVTLEAFPRMGKFRVLYDPHGLLEQFETEVTDYSMSWEEVVRCFHGFSFTLLEFYAAWNRGDQIWSARLASHLAADLGVVLRYAYDPANARLGSKRLEDVLPVDIRDRLRAAVKSCCGDMIFQGVLKLAALMGETMERLESQEGHQAGHKADWKLFKFMVERLERLRKGLRRV